MCLLLVMYHHQTLQTWMVMPCVVRLRIYENLSDVLIEANITTATDPAGVYRVVTPQTHTLATSLPTGVIYRINTGAPLPSGTDSVVIVEDTELVSATPDGEETEVRTLVQTTPGENIRSPGSDVRKGDLVLRKGEILRGTGGEIGTLAFVGRKEVF